MLHSGNGIGVRVREDVVEKVREYARARFREDVKLNFKKYLRSRFGEYFWTRVVEVVIVIAKFGEEV